MVLIRKHSIAVSKSDNRPVDLNKNRPDDPTDNRSDVPNDNRPADPISNRPSKYATKMVFTSAQELKLADYFLKCSKLHFGITFNQSRKLAYEYAKELEHLNTIA